MSINKQERKDLLGMITESIMVLAATLAGDSNKPLTVEQFITAARKIGLYTKSADDVKFSVGVRMMGSKLEDTLYFRADVDRKEIPLAFINNWNANPDGLNRFEVFIENPVARDYTGAQLKTLALHMQATSMRLMHLHLKSEKANRLILTPVIR